MARNNGQLKINAKKSGRTSVVLGSHDEPLTESERALMKRLFSATTDFPQEFKRWNTRWTENNPPRITFREIENRNIDDLELTNLYQSEGVDPPPAEGHVLGVDEDTTGEQAQDGSYPLRVKTLYADPRNLFAAGGPSPAGSVGAFPYWDGTDWQLFNDPFFAIFDTDGAMAYWNGSKWITTQITSLATGDVMYWDGSDWANGDATDIGGSATAMDDLTDADTSSAGTGDLLRYDSGGDWTRWEVPACLAQNTGTHSHTSSGNWQVVACPSTDEYDNDAMHSTSTNNDRITPNTPGVYACSWACQWAVHATGSRFISLTKNGGITYQIGPLSHATHAVRMTVYGNFYMNGTTDYIGIQAYQETGGTTTMTGVKFSAHWVSHGF